MSTSALPEGSRRFNLSDVDRDVHIAISVAPGARDEDVRYLLWRAYQDLEKFDNAEEADAA